MRPTAADRAAPLRVAVAVIINERSEVLLTRRHAERHQGGLWEFPGGKQEPEDANLPATLRREIQEELGVEIEVGAPVTTVEHAYTHFSITLHAFHARIVAGAPRPIGCDDWRWTTLERVDEWPFPVTDQKIIAALRAGAVGNGEG